MFSRFFIQRPIAAAVMSIVIVLGGGVALFTLPVAQYPEIAPPTVEVSAAYPGANAQVVADTVAAPIEQQVNGVENMMYMSSQCTNDGSYTLTITFRPGSDLNISQVLVQNRVSLAEPILPELVRRRGISVKKKSPNVLMIINLFSAESDDPHTRRNDLELSNYATIQIRDELSRLPGVGDITYLGQRDYSMRLWLDPQKLGSYNLNAQDVITAVQTQNVQVAAGQIGQPPTPKGQVTQYIITTLGRLENVRQFGDIIVKESQGTLVRLRDVSRIELGAQSYDQTCTLDGKPSVALSVYQLPGSNALEVARRVKDRMKELKERFPPGVDYAIVYDTTPFINESIKEVFETLFDAVVLVAVVVLVFLQNWRSALIPLIAVPVAVVGTFAAMAAMGFSLNNLTLFGLVLAIGIVVDDAIVVVEAVEHHIEHGMKPRDATIRAMEQVSGPVVAIGLVLAAVFIPCAFISGITGQFFRQFALTIAVSTLISAFNSLTLSPALSALLLRPRTRGHFEAMPWLAWVPLGAWLGHKAGGHWVEPALRTVGLEGLRTLAPIVVGALVGAGLGMGLGRPLNALMAWSFRMFNRAFDASTTGYTNAIARLVRVSGVALLLYAGLLVMTWWGFTHTPTGFIPQQDKGYLLVNVQLPDAASLPRTIKVVEQIENIALDTPGIKHTVAASGQSLLLSANASNFGSLYLMLDDFEHRNRSGLSSGEIAAALQERLQRDVPQAVVNIFEAPPVEGLGTAGGFKIIVQDTGDSTLSDLQDSADRVIVAGEATPELQGLFTSFRADTPWVELRISREQAKNRGLSIADVRSQIETTLGPYYINDFNRFGRTWQVNVQAMSDFRQSIEDIKRLKIRNNKDEMVPLAAFTSVKEVSGPVLIMRYNMYRSASVHAEAGPRTSSGQAIAKLESVAEGELPQTMRHRVDRAGTPPAANGQHGHVGLPAGGGPRFPGAGGAVRKLVAAAGGDPGGADVPALRHHRRRRGADGCEHLHAGRLPRARRPGLQECHPHRRVRQGAARVRGGPLRGDARRLPASLAADRHDVVRVHPRRGAVDAVGRRGRRDAPHARHRGVRRHAGSHALRHLPDPRVLLRDSGIRRPAHARRA